MSEGWDAAVESYLNEPDAPQPLTPRLVDSVTGAIRGDATPDLEAELRRVSARTGVPLDSARADLKYASSQSAIIDMDLGGLTMKSPKLARWLAEPANAKIAVDDIEPLKGVEFSLSALGDLAKASWWATVSGGAGFLQATSPMFEGMGVPGAEGWNDTDNTMGRFLTGLRSQSRQASEALTPKVDNPWAQGVNSGVVSFFQNAPMMAAAVVAKNPNLALAGMAASTGGYEYGKAKDAGKGEGTAVAYGATQGAIEAITEKLPMDALIGDFLNKSGFFKTLGRQLMLEIPGEQVATVAQDFTEWATLNPEKSAEEFIRERGDAAISTLVATGVGVIGHTTVAQITDSTVRAVVKTQKAAEAEQAGEFLDQLSKLSEASKLRGRSVETFEAFVADAARDTPVENVYIDARTLTDALAQASTGEDAQARILALQAMPSVQSQLDVAVATGGDIRIPVSEFAAYAAGSDLAQSMLEHLKTDPAGMSRAEAEAFMQSQGEELRTEIQQAMTAQGELDAQAASADEVRQIVADQLTKANRFTPDVNDAYAQLTAAFYSTMAQRMGMTPQEFYAAHPVDIAAAGVLEGSFTKDQLAQPDQEDPGTFEFPMTAGTHEVRREGTTLRYEVANGRANVLDLDTVPQERGQGQASQIMDDFTQVLDAAGLSSVLVPLDTTGEGSLTDTELASFYARRGYVAARQKGATVMFRNPREVAAGEGPNDLAQADGGSPPRGTFSPEGNLITLLKNADLSTFLHESGHFYLETLARLAAQPDAPADIQRDMATVLRFMKADNMTVVDWLAQSVDKRREGHELFARGFEAYLMEGKSPSTALAGLFQRFRAWLVNIYQQLTRLNVTLDDDVRGVFDRMLATEGQIAAAEQSRSYHSLFKSAEEAGMTPEEWADYQRLGAEATQDAVSALEARSMRDMRWLSGARDKTIRRMQREAAAKRRSLRAEVEAEVMAEPVNRARTFLKFGLHEGQEVEGPTKLKIADVAELYADVAEELQDWRKGLGYGKYGMLAEDGLSPDTVAELYGFTSGSELVEALLNGEDPKAKIEGLTDQRMLERYGDLTDRSAIERAADEAIHNDARLRFVATEANALARATGGRKILADAAREFAGAMVGRLRVRDLKPSRYTAAETRAAANAATLAAKGDLVGAATEKRNQLIQGHAAKAVYAAQEDVAKALRYFARFGNAATRQNLDPDYRDQIDALLSRFDLSKSVTLREIDKRKSLAKWVEAQRALGFEPIIPDELLDEANRKHYRDMTVEELRGLVDSVRNIAHLARLKHRLLAAKDQREFEATVDEASALILANATGPARTAVESNGAVDRAGKGVREFFASHRKFASLIRQMGGFKDRTVLWDVLVRPMNEAADAEAAMREDATVRMHKIFSPIIGQKLRQKLFISEIGGSLSLEGRLMIALNWGNETNRARVMDGDKWTEPQVQAVLKTLTPEHWAFVQDVWDFIDSYWPQIAAKERRVTGSAPEKVEASAVTVIASDGSEIELRGGYFPIKYDPDRSLRAEADNEAEIIRQSMQGLYARATTRRGHTKARVDTVERAIRKDFGVIFEHVSQVAHDLAWHEYLIDANRLLGSAGIDGAIRETYGPEVARTMRKALEDMAKGDIPAQNAFERGINYLRTGATIAGLGWNVTTSLLQPLGLAQSMVRIGPKYVARGIARWAGSAVRLESTVAEIASRSDFMRLRSKTMQREINEVRNRVSASLRPQALTRVEESFFYLIAKMQLIADVPTWLGAYEKAGDLGESEDTAIKLADQAVRDSQGGGQISDLAEIQRGSPLMKLWTNFYSYFNTTYNLMAESIGETRLAGPSRLPLLAADALLLLTVPVILGEVMKTAVRGDDWEELPEQLARQQISYLFGLMVGLREIGSVIGADGRQGAQIAGLRVLTEGGKLVQQAQDGEVDEAFLKAANNTAGIVFHYPAGQVQRTVTGLQALATGQTKNPMALLMGPPRNEK